MTRQEYEIIMAVINGVTKIKRDNQVAEPIPYIDENGIKIIENTIANLRKDD